jgi:HAD superfamily hydrolase (TIGR01484 family)
MILATDLDGTFLGGKGTDRQLLYRFFRSDPTCHLIFVSGRGLASVKSVLSDIAIPRPHQIICDVGATVVDGSTYKAIEPLQTMIADKWPGREVIEEKLHGLEGLVEQEVPQTRRCSYYVADEFAVARVKQRLASTPCEIIYSADKFLDILPVGVNKGTTLGHLVTLMGIDRDKVFVAGDTLNDLSLFQYGFKGIAVGNSETKLLSSIRGLANNYSATAEGAGGILEGFTHFKMLRDHTRDFHR